MRTRRDFIVTTIGAAAASLSSSFGQSVIRSKTKGQQMQDQAEDPRITRARLSGPKQITNDATVAELGADGTLTVLAKGTNEWVCVPGNENKIGDPPMCMNPMGMQWMMDAMHGKPKPTNAAPGIIYMLCGATQHSNTDPFDKSSPAIPIGPHWMIMWPYDATRDGLPNTVRDAGAWVMFDGTPYAYLHICGTPWAGNQYTPGQVPVWAMRYGVPTQPPMAAAPTTPK